LSQYLEDVILGATGKAVDKDFTVGRFMDREARICGELQSEY